MRTVIIAIVSCLSIVASAAPKMADLPQSLGDDFPISFWCSPPDKFVTIEQYQRIKDAGFTLIMPPCAASDVKAIHKMLDTAQAVGLHVFIQDTRMPTAITGVADAKAHIDAIVAEYSKHPALAGYFIGDEPGAGAFPGLAEVVAYLKEIDPAHPGFINLYPNYAPLDALGTKTYDEHVEKYIQTVKPFVVSYDHYHFTNHGDGPLFFKNLESIRRLSIEHGLPFWNIVLATSHFDYRKLTEAEKRYEAMQTLVYGGKGVLFFTYWQPDASGMWHDAIINADGKPTYQYEQIKHVNHDVQAIGRYLLHATSISPPTPQGELNIALFEMNEWRYALIANRNYKTATEAKVSFNSHGHLIKQLDKSAATWNAVDGDNPAVHIAPGDAELYRWRKSQDPNGAESLWHNSLEPIGQRSGPFTITANDQPRCSILIPQKPTTEEQKAADDLQHWVSEITGAKIPITSNAMTGQDFIRIATDPALADEGYSIAADGGNILLTGGRTRGTINAVYALLEEDLGCRWYTQTDVRLPHTPTLRVFPVQRTYIPQLKLRDPFFQVAFEPVWSLRNRTNAPDAKVPEEFGGHIDYGGLFVHTSANLLPPAKYFKDHPEYFMLDKSGKRQPWQWCPTDPDVAKIVTQSVLDALKKNPHAEIISVSKNDSGGDQLCQCDRCKKLRDSEGGAEMATQLFLVNQVAEAVEREYPNVAIDTLAYLDTIQVPKTIRPRHNVVIRLCNDAVGAWVHPFTPASKLDVAKLAQAWSAVHNRIYIWDYHVNFSHYFAPMPNVDVFASNIRFWVKNHAEGVMLQAAYNSIAENDQLKSWVMAKLLWNPALDENELVQDFIQGYYGKVARAMAEYEALVTQASRDHAADLASPPGGIRYPMDLSFLSKDFLDQATLLFTRAKKNSANDPELLRKVERAYLPILYVKLARGPEFTGLSYPQVLDDFDRIAHREGASSLEESGPSLNDKIAAWRKLIPKPVPAAPAPAAKSNYKIISPGPSSGSYQAFPDACRLKNGDILCVFYAGYWHISLPTDECPNGGRICVTRSSDEGKTWSQPQVLFDDENDNRDPHIAQLDDGSLLCTFFSFKLKGPRPATSAGWDYTKLSSFADCMGAQCVRSSDNGRTWGKTPSTVNRDWVCSAPVRQLADGTCVLGLYREQEGAQIAWGGVARSVDRGHTWQAPVPIGKEAGLYLDAETDIVQLKDGSLFAALRSSTINMHYATSPDLGQTWSAVKDIGFKAHCPHLLRLSTGEIILSHRIPNTSIHISGDDAKTWQGPYEIDAVPGAYPSTVELKDHTVLIVYYTEGPGSVIRAAHFKLTPTGIEMLPL